jgi:methanophenazine hydrogenase
VEIEKTGIVGTNINTIAGIVIGGHLLAAGVLKDKEFY